MLHALGLLLFTSALTAQAGAILEVGGAALELDKATRLN